MHLTRSSFQITLLAFIIIVIGVGVLINNNRLHTRTKVRPSELVDLIGPVPMDPVSLNMALDWALEDTKYNNQWTLNSNHDPKKLNIYIFDSSNPEAANHRFGDVFKENAVYISHLNSIAVDYQLVAKLWQRYFPDDESWGARAHLLAWIVGHEVGHLVNNHGTSHFRAVSLLQPRSSCQGNQKEQEADMYFAGLIYAIGDFTLDRQVEIFKRIIEVELSQNSENLTIFDTILGIFGIQSDCNHPEYIIRALRFLKYITDMTDDPVLAAMVDDFEHRLSYPR